jgi:ABC-type glycerol-3-phosphate transport system substrate-binding protein
MSDDAAMTKRSRFTLWALALALVLAACGGDDESEASRAAVAEMLERLGRPPAVAHCMADEFDGTYGAGDFQPVIDARGDYATVDFQLLEDMVVAERDCTEDDS